MGPCGLGAIRGQTGHLPTGAVGEAFVDCLGRCLFFGKAPEVLLMPLVADLGQPPVVGLAPAHPDIGRGGLPGCPPLPQVTDANCHSIVGDGASPLVKLEEPVASEFIAYPTISP